MPTPGEHYRIAEDLLVEAASLPDEDGEWNLALAHVHAILATVRPDDANPIASALQVTK